MAAYRIEDLCGPNKEAAAAHFYREIRNQFLKSFGGNSKYRRSEEDIVQEVLARAIAEAQKIIGGLREPVENPLGWLNRVTRNAAYDQYKRSSKPDRNQLPEDFDPPEDRPPMPAERAALRQALTLLDAPCHELLTLSHWMGLSHREIGARLGISEGNSRIKVYRCLQSLIELAEHGGASSPA